MDCTQKEDDKQAEQGQSIPHADPETYVPWSPSNEFFGQAFNTSTPLTPNELARFCNALTSEVDWTQEAFKSPQVGASWGSGQDKMTESVEGLKKWVYRQRECNARS